MPTVVSGQHDDKGSCGHGALDDEIALEFNIDGQHQCCSKKDTRKDEESEPTRRKWRLPGVSPFGFTVDRIEASANEEETDRNSSVPQQVEGAMEWSRNELGGLGQGQNSADDDRDNGCIDEVIARVAYVAAEESNSDRPDGDL